MSPKVLTRRDFMKSTTAAAAGALILGAPRPVFPGPDKKTRVVLIRHKAVLGDGSAARPDVIAEMLDDAVTVLLDAPDADTAWKRIVKPEDVVGVKSNVWGYLSTPSALEQVIRDRVLAAGVEDTNFDVDDRGVRQNKTFKSATALINVRPARTHHWSGVGSLLKNYIMFVPYPPAYHEDSCADLAKIWKLPELDGKTRLNILVMLTPLFHGVGPHHYSPAYTWAYKGLLVGLDPVAVDATGVRILIAKRKAHFGEDRPINPPPKHVFLADTRHGLGTADPDKIELVKLGWMDDALI